MKSTYFIGVMLLLCLASNSLSAQHSINGSLNDDQNQRLSYGSILLLNAVDSSFIRGSMTNEEGRFIFEQVPSGKYVLSASMLGFEDYFSEAIELNADYQHPEISLRTGISLEEIEVTAKKPLYEQKIDRTVINVENSIAAAGSTALDILERSPGVVINRQNGGISLVGKSGVVVMINGKINYMPISAVVQLLEGMSSDNIQKIELITTPPANFDAEGNAGFINIVMKKRTDIGTNGSYSLSAGYGNGPVTNDNINFNYRKDRINLYGSYSFLYRNQGQIIESRRSIAQGGENLSTSIASDRNPTQRNHNLRLGLDYEITDKTILGVLFSTYDNKWSMDATNMSTKSINGNPISLVQLYNSERNQWQHISGNLNISHKLSEKAKLSFNADYLRYYDENPNDYTNYFFDGNNNFLSEELTRSNKTTPIDIYVGNIDYSNQIKENFKLELGAKITQSQFENDVEILSFQAPIWETDESLTNLSMLNEQILAAYVSTDYAISDKTSIKAGLRYEYTDSKLDTDKDGRVVDRQFGKFFPSVFLNHNFNDNNGINFSYSRRITRPTFNDLAPFVIFLDPNTFVSGNAALQPAIADSYKLDYRYKSYLISFQYTYEDSTVNRFQERVEVESNKLFYESTNLSNTKTFSVSFGFPVQVVKWWEMRNNFLFFSTETNSYYQGEQVSLSQSSFRFNTAQSFQFPNNWSGEISFFYNGPTVQGIVKSKEFYGLNAGIQKKLNGNWGAIRFNVGDILESVRWRWETNIPTQGFETFSQIDFVNRTYTLTYSRNFGSNKIKAKRNRRLGSEAERNRIGN